MKKQRKIQFKFFCPAAEKFVENYHYEGYVDELFDPSNKILTYSQCTGEQDDFGNEIWEGDIIEFKRKGQDKAFKAEIEFTEGAFLAKIVKNERILQWFWLYHLRDYNENIKVIGNKFENKDLSNNL